MAKIFRAIFDEMLPKEDLVELEGRERLPSPQELQGKIILKGSYKVKFPTIIVTYIMSFHTNYINYYNSCHSTRVFFVGQTCTQYQISHTYGK